VISRFLLAAGLAVLMVVSGLTSYFYISSRESKAVVPALKPSAATPRALAFTLPGTLYLVQAGALYRYSAGRFHQLTPEEGWTQPSLYPDGSALVVVKRSLMYSDAYALTLFGRVGGRFTSNQAAPRDAWDTGANAWSFYPRLSPDQKTLFMSYDGPKYAGAGYYDVDMSVWAMTVGTAIRRGRAWTTPNNYTGGDIEPIPLRTGGVVYTKYSYNAEGNRIGQLWYTDRPGAAGKALTSPSDDCAQPAVAPDGGAMAMICTYGKQVSYLTIALWSGSSLGPLRTVISKQLVAQPTWAPDSSGIAYLSPNGPVGPFQLWWLPRAAYDPPAPSPVPTPVPTPGGPHNSPLPSPTLPVVAAPPPVPPVELTTNLDLDATSTMAWGG
jgi:hypothetical protein